MAVCLCVSISVWIIVICCVVSVLSYETRSSFFVTSAESKSPSKSSDAEFSCALLCSATTPCRKAIITEEDGTEVCTLVKGEEAEKLSDIKGSVKLQKLGAFDFGEREFQLTQDNEKGVGLQNEKPLLRSCRKIFEHNGSATDGTYNIILNDDTKALVYCVMSAIPGCGGGGWTLAMKIDGQSPSFDYHSQLWNNTLSHNAAAASGGLDSQEMKSPAYWGVPLTTGLCLGMRVNNRRPGKHVMLPYSATSLYSVIADNRYKNTSLGPETWKSLINGSYLHDFCRQEGFNTHDGQKSKFRARMGIVSKTERSLTGVSVMGFGTGLEMSCGNYVLGRVGGAAGSSQYALTAFGYILVQ